MDDNKPCIWPRKWVNKEDLLNYLPESNLCAHPQDNTLDMDPKFREMTENFVKKKSEKITTTRSIEILCDIVHEMRKEIDEIKEKLKE